MKNEEYKKLSIAEFTKAAGRYESNHAGIYEMCKKDYPDILEELEKEPFRDLLDAGCGPAPMISLLAEKYPDRHYTGLDLTPAMIEHIGNASGKYMRTWRCSGSNKRCGHEMLQKSRIKSRKI